jgi:putative ABC transport system substrate-binding protein
VKRRELMLSLGGAMTTARALHAQPKPMPVIGYLATGSPAATASYVAAFHEGLSETGYVEGQNVAIEYRWAEGHYDRLPALAADLVARNVDVIAAGGIPAAVRRKARPRRSRSSLPSAPTRSGTAWSPASPGRVATSQA